MATLTLKEIQARLQDRKLYVVAVRTGLSYPTLKKLHDGIEANYESETIEAVSAYLNYDL